MKIAELEKELLTKEELLKRMVIIQYQLEGQIALLRRLIDKEKTEENKK